MVQLPSPKARWIEFSRHRGIQGHLLSPSLIVSLLPGISFLLLLESLGTRQHPKFAMSKLHSHLSCYVPFYLHLMTGAPWLRTGKGLPQGSVRTLGSRQTLGYACTIGGSGTSTFHCLKLLKPSPQVPPSVVPATG